jgi:hypothetical protein
MAAKDKAQEKRRQARKRKKRQERRQKRQRWAAAKVARAEEKPKAEPRAVGHLMERFWHHLQFDKHTIEKKSSIDLHVNKVL